MGVRSRELQIVHYLAMFKVLLLPNYISEQPQFFRDASNFAKYWKKTLSTLCLSKVKGHGTPKLTFSSSWYKVSKISKPRHGFISWQFSLICGRIVADNIIFDLRKFYCKISKGLWDILGQTWHEMKNWKRGVPLSPRLPMTAVKICVENFFTYSLHYATKNFLCRGWDVFWIIFGSWIRIWRLVSPAVSIFQDNIIYIFL